MAFRNLDNIRAKGKLSSIFETFSLMRFCCFQYFYILEYASQLRFVQTYNVRERILLKYFVQWIIMVGTFCCNIDIGCSLKYLKGPGEEGLSHLHPLQ